MKDEIAISQTDAELCCSALEDAIGDLEAAKKRRKEGLTPSERTLARLYRSTRQTLRGKMDRDQVDDHGYRILRHNREVSEAHAGMRVLRASDHRNAETDEPTAHEQGAPDVDLERKILRNVAALRGDPTDEGGAP